MDTSSAFTRLDAALANQLALAGSDPAVEAAARALSAALESTMRVIAADLAEQAAEEIRAQLSGHEVEVVLQEGEPNLVVRTAAGSPPPDEDFEARLTLRLPPTLKSLVEEAASETGDSVNAWVVKTLSTRAQHAAQAGHLKGRRVTGTVRT